MKNIFKITVLLSLISLITISCTKEEDNNDNSTPDNQTDVSLGAFICEIDGEDFNMTVTSSGANQSGSSSSSDVNTSVSPIETKASYSASIDNLTTGERVGVSIGELQYTGTTYPEDALFKTLFTIGNYTFTEGGINGVDVWMIIDGVEWSSARGTASQSGSTFNILSITEVNNNGTLYLEVEATFSCKVYDGNGNINELTNGTFVGKFGNI